MMNWRKPSWKRPFCYMSFSPLMSVGMQTGSPDIRKRIVLVPPTVFMKEWKDDYEAMRGTMVFGSSLAFDDLIERLRQLQERFHNIENK